MIAIVDYGLGNISAFVNIFNHLGEKYVIATTREELLHASKIILPGVGAFDFAMRKLNSSGLRETVDELVQVNKIPVLGICVGMQMMADNSEEGTEPGLSWISGKARKFDEALLKVKPTIPHMGWNSISGISDEPLLRNIDLEDGFYFLHSYFFEVIRKEDELASSFYGRDFSSAIHRDNVYGVQFHPEKSLENGVRLIRNFLEL